MRQADIAPFRGMLLGLFFARAPAELGEVGSGDWHGWRQVSEVIHGCYWVGSLGFNFLGNKGVFR